MLYVIRVKCVYDTGHYLIQWVAACRVWCPTIPVPFLELFEETASIAGHSFWKLSSARDHMCGIEPHFGAVKWKLLEEPSLTPRIDVFLPILISKYTGLPCRWLGPDCSGRLIFSFCSAFESFSMIWPISSLLIRCEYPQRFNKFEGNKDIGYIMLSANAKFVTMPGSAIHKSWG